MNEKKEQTNIDFEGDPNGKGPLPHGKYSIKGSKAVLAFGVVCFLAGFFSAAALL